MKFRATFIVVLLSACSQFEGTADTAAVQPDGGLNPGQDGHVVTGEPGVGITIAPIITRRFVAQGQSVEIPIYITRAVGSNDAVHVVVSDLPTGVSVRAIDIPSDGTDGKLTVAVSTTATQGAVDLSISASGDSGVNAKGTLPLFVRGAPGALDTTFAPDPLLLTVMSSTSATLSAFPDGSMVVAGETGKSLARLIRVDAEGKNLAANDSGLGRFVAALPDGRLLDFSATSFGRYSDKLVRDPAFNGTGIVASAFTKVLQVDATTGAVLG